MNRSRTHRSPRQGRVRRRSSAGSRRTGTAGAGRRERRRPGARAAFSGLMELAGSLGLVASAVGLLLALFGCFGGHTHLMMAVSIAVLVLMMVASARGRGSGGAAVGDIRNRWGR